MPADIAPFYLTLFPLISKVSSTNESILTRLLVQSTNWSSSRLHLRYSSIHTSLNITLRILASDFLLKDSKNPLTESLSTGLFESKSSISAKFLMEPKDSPSLSKCFEILFCWRSSTILSRLDNLGMLPAKINISWSTNLHLLNSRDRNFRLLKSISSLIDHSIIHLLRYSKSLTGLYNLWNLRSNFLRLVKHPTTLNRS